MDEQTIQRSTVSEGEQSSAWDDTADGAAYPDYDEAHVETAMPEEDEAEEDYEGYPTEDDEIEPDGVRLGADGSVEFGDEFFGDMPEEAKVEAVSPESPKFYTDEELRNTPYEQWNAKRLNGDVSRFAPIVQEQIQQRNAQARAQTIENIPMPSDISEVRPYTPKELSDEAMKLACEKLGLEDPEDFDDYEGEHRAAMQLAMNELMEKRNAEVQGYNRGREEWGQLQRFNAELSKQPDFKNFNEWYTGKLQEAGVTAEQVNAGLYQYARRNGNRFSVIPQIIGTWYSEYQRERGNAPRMSGNVNTVMNRPKRATRPPVLESTRGNDYSGRRKMNLQTFGDMDSDEQASALMHMGLV